MTRTILIVEDDEDNIYITSKRLKRGNYTVLQARNGLEGVEVATKEQPDLILMDIRMPEMDGLEATRRLKGADETRAIPIIALTGEAMEHQRREALDAGCDDFHPKPMVYKRLLAQMESLLPGGVGA